MNGCFYQTVDGQCMKYSDPNLTARSIISWCVGKDAPCEGRVPSNHDVITNMNPYDMADWICKILMCHADLIRHITFDMGVECGADCPLYYCCNDQPTDNIEGWLNSPADKEDEA